MLLALTRLVMVPSRVAASVSVFLTVLPESTVALFVSLHDAVATERLAAVFEAVVLAVQLIQHCI